ncbi:MAG TPA: NBR1-Ig-like domain-containing protein [Anaerolineales bacterium]|nr:NBR1-Ig-like domain-containing protein [Anaerolineales bacterium]
MNRTRSALLLTCVVLSACGQASPPVAPPLPTGTSAATAVASPTVEPTATATSIADPPATIRGVLWRDHCTPGPGSPTDACVQTSGDLHGDGQRAPDEPGVSQVTISLGLGPCPAAGLGSTLTSADGSYSFAELAPGTYCVSIVIQVGDNLASLGPGRWTYPALDQGGSTVGLQAGEERDAVDFGWSPEATAVATGTGCTDLAAFDRDVTIPDDTVVKRGDALVKTWALKNVGSCTWGVGYSLTFAGGESMGAPEGVPLMSAVPAGQIAEFSVTLTAPATSGLHVGYWLLSNPAGQRFGVGNNGNDFFWVRIQVSWPVGSGAGGASGGVATPPSDQQSGACAAQLNSTNENLVVALINQQRTDRGLSPLTQDSRLSAAARGHSVDMACNALEGHIGSDGSNWGARIQAQGYSYRAAYENVYYGSPTYGATPEGAVVWWMNSQVHRDNILRPDISEIGVGYGFGGPYSYGYYTVNFARP